MALEDEREEIKALKRKHTSNTKDLQRQIAHCKRQATPFVYCSTHLLFCATTHLCTHSVVCGGMTVCVV